MTFRRTKNVAIQDTKLSLKQAFASAAGIFAAGALTGAIGLSLMNGNTSSGLEEVYNYETFNSGYFPNGNFEIESNNCVLEGRVAVHLDTIEDRTSFLIELRKAMDTDPKTEIPAMGEKFANNVSWVTLECKKPAPKLSP